MGLLKIIFIIFLLSLPLAELGRIQFSNGIAFTPNELLLAFLILSWLIFKIFRDRNIKRTNLLKPSVFFTGFALIALLLNFFNLKLNEFFVSSLYLLRWVAYLSIFYIIGDFDPKFIKKIPYLLILDGIIVLAGGYIQYFLYPSLRNLYYLGWDEHLYRMFSSFLDPDFLGAFLVLLFILVLGIGFKFFKENKKFLFLGFIFLDLPILLGVYLTYSRSALLMLIISVAVFLFLIGKKKLIFVSVLALILIIFFLPKSFKTEGTNFLRTASGEARINSLDVALRIFQKNPVYGVGFDAYRYAQNKYGLNNKEWMITHSGAGTDNSFVFVLATTGIIGFVFYVYLLYSIFKLAENNKKNNIYSLVLFSSLFGLLVDSLFLNSLFYVYILEWVWIIAAVTESR